MYTKMIVDVIALHTKAGKTRPVKMRLGDGTVVEIDRFLHSERAASTKVGGCGTRYTVMIRGKERYIFEDDGVWYVEAEVRN